MCRKKLWQLQLSNVFSTFSVRLAGHRGVEQVEGREHHWWEEVQLEELVTRASLRAAQPAHHTSTYFATKSLIKPSAQLILIAQGIFIDMTTTTPAFKTQPSLLWWLRLTGQDVQPSQPCFVVSCSMPPSLYEFTFATLSLCLPVGHLFPYKTRPSLGCVCLRAVARGGFHFQTKPLQHNFKWQPFKEAQTLKLINKYFF